MRLFGPNVVPLRKFSTEAFPPHSKRLRIEFTCSYEGPDCVTPESDRRISKEFSKDSYDNGVVLIRCPCDKLHLISDKLGWFDDESFDVEDLDDAKKKRIEIAS